ncbi:subtilisin-like protein [Lactarius psammicola]|nr:subtilisin-like protein [Lactarius psammicola]
MHDKSSASRPFLSVPVRALCTTSLLNPGYLLIMRCHHLSVLSVLAAAPLANFATSFVRPWDDIRVKHTWNAVPSGWDTLGHPPAGTTIDLHVALKAHNESALIDTLYKVSDPKSPKHVLSNTLLRTMYSHVPPLCRRYGAHLSKEQVAQLVAPHPDTLELINSWFQHHGVPSSSISTTHGGSWLTLTGVPVSQANALLGASYQLYRRTGTNDTTILRTIGYALPTVLHTHVQTVVPTTYFTSMRTLQQSPADIVSREPVTTLSSRSNLNKVTPSDLRWLYKTTAYVPAATDRNKIGIGGFLNEYPSPVDLRTYMTAHRTDAVGVGYRVAVINGGGYDPRRPSIEGNLNMQWTQAMAYPTPLIFYSTGGIVRMQPNNEPAKGDLWLEWLRFMLKDPNVPQTIVTPYSHDESDLPREYTTALCKLFAQLGARGVSVIFTSGNGGVGMGKCVAKDGSGKVQFNPEFPSTCPWVTSVGGTTDGTTFEGPEVGADLSGGGFSNHFPRPDYQDEAVPAFLQNLGSEHNGLYNATGRGIPDISAQALRLSFILNNQPVLSSGTSGAAPVGAHSGFLNPWLYSNGRAGINDITSGSNPGCGTDGFSAVTGWDPVTGLGTPDFVGPAAYTSGLVLAWSSTRCITRE